jgi:protein-S-isoprenylcysteine O-methyltransferase Ste14
MGVEGVYYGCEMIKKCTYITEFPYNCINHPMYTAAILSVFGSGFLMGFDNNYAIRLNIWIPLGYLTMLYMYSIMIENQPSLVYKRIKNR